MGRFIIKLQQNKKSPAYYLEWSTVVDAPVSYGMTLDEFKKYYKKRYGEEGMKDLKGRLERVEKYGTSAFGRKLKDFINYNRAGENEARLKTKKSLINRYCK